MFPFQTKKSLLRPPSPRLRAFIALATLGLALASCSDSGPSRAPSVPVTDTRPVGEGLKTVAYALLGGAVVLVLGRLIRS